VASLSQGRTAAAQCGLFTHKSVPVIFEPPCILLRFLRILWCNLLFLCPLFPQSCPTNFFSKKFILLLFFGQIKICV